MGPDDVLAWGAANELLCYSSLKATFLAPNYRFFNEDEIVSPVKRLTEVLPLLGVVRTGGGLSEFRCFTPKFILIYGMAKPEVADALFAGVGCF